MYNRRVIKFLDKWRQRKQRKPLILRGARQVGKTSAVEIFAKRYFKYLIDINLEKAEHLRLFNNQPSLDEFLTIIKAEFKISIIPGETLIFIDEIQNSPHLIKLLRFFYEERPELHIIVAGSLLEAMITREGFSFPVGRVEFCYMYPLDFFEYLEAKQENELLKMLKTYELSQTIPEAIHQMALRIFYEYAMIGGMPEAVAEYLSNHDINNVVKIYSALMAGYLDDVYKYASQADAKYISFIIENAPLFAGTQITYEKFGGSNFRSREMSKAFTLLEKVRLLYQIRATQSNSLPLVPKERRAKKLIYVDIGLINYRLNVLNEYLSINDFGGFFRGKMAEQLVAQNIFSQYIDEVPRIYYWARDRKEGSAEVDFCLNFKGKTLGVEVKSGKVGRLKSLSIFAKYNQESTLIRVYSGRLTKEKINNRNMISLPFYMVPRIFDFIDTNSGSSP
ncbi:ATP-binding protein [Candidatus Margulisiibacteriota bacterium]